MVDSSVWIDYFRGTATPQAARLDVLLGNEPLCVGDLILAEVLQGFNTDREFNQARKLMDSLEIVTLGGREMAIQAARNYCALRLLGITVRNTIDTFIATCCMEKKITLLFSDRDFDPFVEHMGLCSAMSRE